MNFYCYEMNFYCYGVFVLFWLRDEIVRYRFDFAYFFTANCSHFLILCLLSGVIQLREKSALHIRVWYPVMLYRRQQLQCDHTFYFVHSCSLKFEKFQISWLSRKSPVKSYSLLKMCAPLEKYSVRNQSTCSKLEQYLNSQSLLKSTSTYTVHHY